MILWRIAAETRSYRATDLSGTGAAKHPGRWNGAGEPVVYAAPTRAMAVLETAAHIDDAGLPLNRFLVEITVPDDMWAAREEIEVASLPLAWSAIPAGHASVAFGSAWLAAMRSPVLLAPSVVLPEEQTALLNPKYPGYERITAKVARSFEYNKLFRF
jgi:RES domain-containing protein